jgi:PilZ domain-containing protein
MGKRREPRKEIQLPVRIFGTDSSGKMFSENAFTVNVGQNGAELSGVRPDISLDETVGVSYGANRGRFKVRWVGKAGTPKAGHVGLLNISPEKAFWDFPLPVAAKDDYQPPVSQLRKHHRIKCHNSVALHTSDGASFWGTVADLSVAGCYVEMAIPLAPGSKVSLSIWIGESKVWVDGEVAFSTPGMGIGVKFGRVSEQDLERIREYLAPLSYLAKKPTFDR